MKLEVSNIRAGYGGGADVLKDVSVTVQKGTVVGLIGANGAGKSTLLRTICGFLKPRAGDVVLDDRTATGLRPDSLAARGIGYLMEGHSVFPSLTVEENLQLGTWSFRNDRDRVKRVPGGPSNAPRSSRRSAALKPGCCRADSSASSSCSGFRWAIPR